MGSVFAIDGEGFARREKFVLIMKKRSVFLFHCCLLLEETLLVMISLRGLRLIGLPCPPGFSLISTP